MNRWCNVMKYLKIPVKLRLLAFKVYMAPIFRYGVCAFMYARMS